MWGPTTVIWLKVGDELGEKWILVRQGDGRKSFEGDAEIILETKKYLVGYLCRNW